MREYLKMEAATSGEIMTTLRLATGGVCSLAGLGLDAGEDCKVCLTESLLLLSHAGYGRACIAFFEDGGLFVRITAEGTCGEAAPVPEDDISAALLEALAAGVQMEKREGRLFGVSFRFATDGRN